MKSYLPNIKKNIQGIGMGPTIINNIISNMAGKIEVSSIPDKGTTFNIQLNKYFLKDGDIIHDDSKTVKPLTVFEKRYKTDHKKQVKENRYNVLLVEDNEYIVDMLDVKLNKIYNVNYASNGEEGLARLKTISRPDVIISDIMMDKMDGYEFFDRVNENSKSRDIPYIFIQQEPQGRV